MTSQIPNKSTPLPPGVYCPVLSLYKTTARQEIDLEASYNYFKFLILGGVTGLVLAGTTAEAVLLSADERVELTKVAKKVVTDLGLPDYPLVAGISGQSTNESIRLAEAAKEAGADFGLLLPPSYWSKVVTKDVILGFYREVADASPMPVVIYNFPAVTAGIDLDSDIIAELAEHPNIVGVKLTCGNVGKLTRLTADFNPKQFAVYGGSSDYLIPALIGGGSGCVTGIGNVYPKSVSKLYALYQEGKIAEAAKLQGLVAHAEKACKAGIAATKYGAAYFAGPVAGVNDKASFLPRKPYVPANETMQAWVVKTMAHLEKVEKELPDRQCPGL
ncbi:hypothetical protein BP5796_12472 [Coleophoma crateriformis]|uniref:Dihydrodipicolinate synthase n=1 Tax=Coleophoma crateriformis TaxID=565419 RepID=A0A3D8Q793_9HELO|nr:hypothetical protein BP5796_12472 [Coleophoma crateriformis]